MRDWKDLLAIVLLAQPSNYLMQSLLPNASTWQYICIIFVSVQLARASIDN